MSGLVTGLGSKSGLIEPLTPRIWINFDGTGTPNIRRSRNVSSISDNDVGYYTINFVGVHPDNYVASGLLWNDDENATSIRVLGVLTTSLTIQTMNDSVRSDEVVVMVQISY
jgi:hypothetical protein